MLWTEVHIATSTAGIEPVAGIILMQGINGYAVEDSEDFKEFLNDENTYWDYIEDELVQRLSDCETMVIFYIPDNSQGREQLLAVKSEITRLKATDTENKFGRLELSFADIKEEDWENNWKQYFKPFRVGERIIIKPTWEEYIAKEDDIVLELDPSSSFGTGSHATTSLCLEQIEKEAQFIKGNDVLDMGCGSGILGICAEKFGAKHITAVDIDQNSVRIANENASQNNIPDEKYSSYVGSITSDRELYETISQKKYSYIFANIVADVLIAMRDSFAKLLADGGKIILSGIISERKDEVICNYEENGFETVETYEKNGWVCSVMRLK